MTEATAVEGATIRLERALRALEEAVDCRLEREHGRGDLSDELYNLGVDRSRLASELDQAIARAIRLEQANRAVAGQLESAIQSIQKVIAGEP